MRNLILTIVPAIALMAVPAFAQSSSASETTTTTVAPAPVPAQTMTKKVYKSESGPDGQTSVEAGSKTVTTDAYGDQTQKSVHHEETNSDGSHSESTSEKTSTGPN